MDGQIHGLNRGVCDFWEEGMVKQKPGKKSKSNLNKKKEERGPSTEAVHWLRNVEKEN